MEAHPSVYRPGRLRQLLSESVAVDPATLLVELDVLLLRSGAGLARTCPLFLSHEDNFLAKAQLTSAFAEQYQLEAAQYEPGSTLRLCLSNEGSDWSLAHQLSDQRIATRLCYRMEIEIQFSDIVLWWKQLDPGSHFASVKQGTFLTAMIRGGGVSMMPWDNDLELSLYSTGANIVMSWCSEHLKWDDRAKCIVDRLQIALKLPCSSGSDFLSEWLFDEHQTFAKFRIALAGTFDITFEGWVPLMPISVMMFGRAEVRVSWPLWEHLFFEVFSGNMVKKIGTSGNINADVESCASAHNACMPTCQDLLGKEPCIIEFDDYIAHSRDPYGNLFSES